LCREFIAIQRISYADMQPLTDDRLDSKFVMESLAEEQTSADSFVRISRVQKIAE